MLKIIYTTTLFTIITTFSFAQSLNMGRPINTPSNERNPSVSGDGKYMILETDYGAESFYPVMTTQVSYAWSRPKDVTGAFNRLTHDKDWAMNYSGDELFFSSTRHGGVGLSDIWYSKKQGDTWSTPINLAKPVNSTVAETNPCISPDDKRLYFVRSTGKKGPDGQDCGKIYYTEKTSGFWKAPVALSPVINTGCECSPEILNDNKTLIFKSIRPGGKGGFDLYKSVLQNDGKWSIPVPLSFFNTEKDENSVSYYGKGAFFITTGLSNGKDDIFKVKVPKEFQPLPFERLNSQIANAKSKKTVMCKVYITNEDNKEIASFYNNGPGGSLHQIISGNEPLQLTAYPVRNGYFFKSLHITPGENKVPAEILLTPVLSGEHVPIDGLSFTTTADIARGAEELDKFVKVLKDNPEASVEIAVYMAEVTQDSIPTPELTELKIDTLITTKIIKRPIVDSTAMESSILDTMQIDTAASIAYTNDTLTIVTLKKTYNNNRTQKEAAKVKAYLVSKGIAASRITPVGYGDTKKNVPVEDKKLVELIVQ